MVKGMDVYIYTYTNYKHRNLTLNICSPSYDPLACFLAKTSPNWHFKTTVFYGVGFLTPCPTTNMEGQGFKSGFTPLVGLYKLDFVLFMYYNHKVIIICILLSRLILYHACCNLLTSSISTPVDLWNTKLLLLLLLLSLSSSSSSLLETVPAMEKSSR